MVGQQGHHLLQHGCTEARLHFELRHVFPSPPSAHHWRDGVESGKLLAFNRDVYCMPVTDEAHALQIVEQVAPIFERFGVEMETLHAQQRMEAKC